MKSFRLGLCCLLATLGLLLSAQALEKQPSSVYHARRVALAGKLHGGLAVLFAGEEALVDFAPYRQDEDFYYLTGWNEPGAALLVVAEPESAPPALDMTAPQAPRKYTEILFLPTRNLRQEKYTGVKLDAATPGAAQTAGVDEVKPMTDLPRVLNDLIAADRRLNSRIWGEPDSGQVKAIVQFTAATLGEGRRRDRDAQKGQRRIHCRAARDDEGSQAGRDRARAFRKDDGRMA